MEKFDKHEIRLLMKRDVEYLLSLPDAPGLQWTGTRADLVDLVHESLLEADFFDATGRRLTFLELINRLKRKLHVQMAPNFYQLLSQRERCKSPQVRMINRYHSMIARGCIRPVKGFYGQNGQNDDGHYGQMMMGMMGK